MIEIVANGKPRAVAAGTTIAAFVTALGWRVEWVVVERNGEPVDRSSYDDIVLAAADRVEVVRAVAGG